MRRHLGAPDACRPPVVDASVDFTDSRALCAHLADLGADVIRVERGDPPDSLAHAYRANKRGVLLDLTIRTGRLDELLAARTCWSRTPATPMIRRPPAPRARGADRSRVERITVRLAPNRSPRWHVGRPVPASTPPCNAPRTAHDCASVYGAVGAVAAVLDRARRRRHRPVVEVSARRGSPAIPWSAMRYPSQPAAAGTAAQRRRRVRGAPPTVGCVVVGSPKQWAGFKALMRNPDIFEAEWATRTSDREPNVFRMVAQERLTDRTRAELFTEALGYGATVGVLHQPSEFVAHPQTRTRKFFTDSNCTG